jgi:DNA polymerase
MFIGEGPGFHENEQGLPFVGQAGKFLNELLQTAGLKREDVFITNVVKCRPPGNRDPQIDELDACKPHLEKQIEIIDPFVIVTLGRFSMARYFPNTRISQIHGKPDWLNERFIVPMYHPAAALHQPKLRPVIKQDFSRLPDMVAKAKEKKDLLRTEGSDNSSADATQLSLL